MDHKSDQSMPMPRSLNKVTL